MSIQKPKSIILLYDVKNLQNDHTLFTLRKLRICKSKYNLPIFFLNSMQLHCTLHKRSTVTNYVKVKIHIPSLYSFFTLVVYILMPSHDCAFFNDQLLFWSLPSSNNFCKSSKPLIKIASESSLNAKCLLIFKQMCRWTKYLYTTNV